MNEGHPEELRELVARLSDGSLEVGEAARLNELLKGDPIAQESFLDHLMVDALLEREFAESALTIPASAVGASPAAGCIGGKDRRLRLLARFFSALRLDLQIPVPMHRTRIATWASVLLLLLIGGVVARHLLPGRHDRPGRSEHAPRLIVGFETDAPKSGAAWGLYGDEVERVGEYLGVTPVEGRRMLRFVSPSSGPGDACEVYQVVDLRPLNAALRPESVVEASASFNSLGGEIDENDYAFGIMLFAFSDDPTKEFHDWPQRWRRPLDFSGRQLSADDAPQTWQQVDTRMPLPAGARYLVVRLSVLRADPKGDEDFPGQFVDQLALRFVDAR